MQKNESDCFNQKIYKREWDKKNMMIVRASYSSDFVKEFKQACSDLGVSQSSVIRKSMQQTIEKAKKVSK